MNYGGRVAVRAGIVSLVTKRHLVMNLTEDQQLCRGLNKADPESAQITNALRRNSVKTQHPDGFVKKLMNPIWIKYVRRQTNSHDALRLNLYHEFGHVTFYKEVSKSFIFAQPRS